MEIKIDIKGLSEDTTIADLNKLESDLNKFMSDRANIFCPPFNSEMETKASHASSNISISDILNEIGVDTF